VLPNTLVVDSLGHWMAQWHRDFKTMDIRNLRSHEHMHCCPYDFQSLQVWAETQGREAELKPTEHVDRKECRKRGYNGPFVVPASKLFLDFSHSLVGRYGLASMVRRGTVRDIRILTAKEDSSEPRLFQVQLEDGRHYITRKVVSAIGPGPAWRAELPWWANDLDQSMRMRVQHSSTLTEWLSQNENEHMVKSSRVLVIGGGQTAAHLAKLALDKYSCSVMLASRRHITRKQFDVEWSLVGDRRPSVLREYLALKDPKKRLDFNAALRNGGSMSSDLYSYLNNSHNTKGGGFILAEGREVEQCLWSQSRGGIKSAGSVGLASGEIQIRFNDGLLESFDYIWLATGGDLDMELVPIYASLQAQYPIDCVHGMPVLREDLSWAENVPLYVMGAFAQLQLEADALNLAGAPSGAVLIARTLRGRIMNYESSKMPLPPAMVSTTSH
jgi:hypothetical protein